MKYHAMPHMKEVHKLLSHLTVKTFQFLKKIKNGKTGSTGLA
jgi:hypothetical protein